MRPKSSLRLWERPIGASPPSVGWVLMVLLFALWPLRAGSEETPASAPLLQIQGISTDPDYGFTPEHPVKLGGIPTKDMDARIESYSRMVVTAEGMPLVWEHLRPCCPFATPHGLDGEEGMLEIYLLTLPNQRRLRFFVNHYEEGPVLAPVGTLFHRSLEEASVLMPGRHALAMERWDGAEAALRQPAEAGNPLARYYMGMIQMARQRAPEALPWFLKAAEQGHAPSQRLAGMILLKSAKSGANAQRGMGWLLKAALNRDAEARGQLSRELIQGRHGAKDLRQAALWARLAAEQGYVPAQLDLGLILLKGEGVPKNPLEGLGWLALAKQAGHPEARELFDRAAASLPATMTVAANQFVHVWPTLELPSESVSRLWMEAEEGDADAQMTLALALYHGAMVNRLVESALFYALLSSEVGTPGAATLAELIAKDLPPETLQRIRHQVKVWKPS